MLDEQTSFQVMCDGQIEYNKDGILFISTNFSCKSSTLASTVFFSDSQSRRSLHVLSWRQFSGSATRSLPICFVNPPFRYCVRLLQLSFRFDYLISRHIPRVLRSGYTKPHFGVITTLPPKMGPSSLLLFLCALPSLALTPDPSGASKVGNGAHQSSIGSQCISSLDCGANGNTACCAFLPQAGGPTIGICSGCGATTQAGKQGCGFGDQGTNVAGQPQVCPASSFAQAAAAGVANASVAAAPSSPPAAVASASSSSCLTRRRVAKHEQRLAAQQLPVLERQTAAKLPDPTLDAGAGNGKNAQFITGQCVNANDCGASQSDLSKVCCASVVDQATGQTVGVCSGSAVGNAAPKLGCGFGDGLANSALANPAGPVAASSSSSGEASCDTGNASTANAAAAAPEASAAPPVTQPQPAQLPDPSLDAGKGNQQNKQFVTGACTSSKDCGAQQADLANVCCASVMSGGQIVGVCSGSAVGNAAPKMGCGFGDGKINSAA